MYSGQCSAQCLDCQLTDLVWKAVLDKLDLEVCWELRTTPNKPKASRDGVGPWECQKNVPGKSIREDKRGFWECDPALEWPENTVIVGASLPGPKRKDTFFMVEGFTKLPEVCDGDSNNRYHQHTP